MTAGVAFLAMMALSAALLAGFFGTFHPALDSFSHFRIHLSVLTVLLALPLLASSYRLQAVAATLAIRDRVHFLGERRPDEIGLLLASLDVFVFPSEAETFGLAAVEAADAGIPVVSHDMPVMREVLQVEGAPCALFVDAADTEAFAARVRRLLIDRAEYDQLSALGRQLGAAHSLEAMVASYRALIEGTAPAGRPLPQPARTGKAA